ncbi:ribose ABC transport system, periplasmic ribose-binding protein RbsB [Klebsiella pneumoniae]|nr:ribose ABC transport system, periplasmic ribose-binding protein RbsB [Klebsiella pneumoniae]SBZ48776.1 ribose ABC transport system, periplasmic ribose-binding protein RbsB [Klebsiella pneumoniae]SBZ55004.1 ribose ABC transport system, periplasmic ribose-binding protein RbsB [Klebsiella pneumoniae]SBZ62905.1 ribose ABC transport system, periplasmic ribose-binding protein RbsB [Klebsiella pneumoniae]SBZ71734.1 ribose ABC transport system, periplasmic ribose-binding protein RbsB [Klebsiella pne
MKHCKIILLVGLLASSASALAEKIGVSMAYFDQNFLTIIRQSIEKEAQARHVDVQFEDARGDTGRQGIKRYRPAWCLSVRTSGSLAHCRWRRWRSWRTTKATSPS